MRVVIFGGRTIRDRALLERAIANAAAKGIVPTAVAWGQAPGVDALGKMWADEHGVPVEPFSADWDDLDAPGAIVRKRRDGSLYNARAGPDRNRRMGEWAEAGIGVWDGVSPGTKDMISVLRNFSKPVHVEPTGTPAPGLFDEIE